MIRRWPRAGDVARVKLPPDVPGQVVGLVARVTLSGMAVTLVGDDVPGLSARVPSDSVEILREAPPRWVREQALRADELDGVDGSGYEREGDET